MTTDYWLEVTLENVYLMAFGVEMKLNVKVMMMSFGKICLRVKPNC